MHLLRTILLIGATFALASIAGALKPHTLQGEFQLAGPLGHKGSPGEGQSHLYLSLTHQAARNLYESLSADWHEDPCTGYRVKALGNVACYEIKPNEEHLCSFPVDLARGVIEAGLGGCI